MIDRILCLIIAVMLFGIWLFASVFISIGDEWWSAYTINMEEMSPFNVTISWIKVFISGFIFSVISFFLVKIFSDKK